MKKRYERKTRETEIVLEWREPGERSIVESPCGFMNHMLLSMFYHGGFHLYVDATGDIHVDYHHLVEDLGIIMGRSFHQRALEMANRRFGSAIMPMDESLIIVAVDISGRGGLFWEVTFPCEKCGDFDLEILKEFWEAFTRESRITLHINQISGDNSHHIAEAIFKGAGIAIGEALTPETDIKSTKGTLL